MPSTEALQTLMEKRAAGVKAASENRDVDDLMSWHSEEAKFVDGAHNFTIIGKEAVRGFYGQAYAGMPTFKVNILKLTGYTPEFMTCEMECEGEASIDLPGFGLKAGDTLKLRGVSLFWWKWEGEGEGWDGTVSDAAVRGWKIIEEHAYHQRV